MVKKLLTILTSFAISLLTLASPTFAQTLDSASSLGATDPNAICGIGNTDLSKFISQFFGCGLGLIGGVALLFIIYGGFLLVMSGGNPRRIQEGREYIMYSIIGLLLAIFALIILQTVGVRILQIPGFG